MSGQKNLVLWITSVLLSLPACYREQNNIVSCTVNIVSWRCSNKVVCDVCLIWNSAITRRESYLHIYSLWLGFLLCPSNLVYLCLCRVSDICCLCFLLVCRWAFCGDGSSVIQKIMLVDHSDPSDLISCESPPQVQVSLIIVLIWAEKKEQMANTNLWKVILFSLLPLRNSKTWSVLITKPAVVNLVCDFICVHKFTLSFFLQVLSCLCT